MTAESYLCRTIGHWLTVEADSPEEAGRKSRATPLDEWSGHTAHNRDRECSRCEPPKDERTGN